MTFTIDGEYTCAVCHQTYAIPPDWDPYAEAKAWLSDDEIATGSEVCEDCWQKMHAGMPDMAQRFSDAGLEL